jgi:hypothetical protein
VSKIEGERRVLIERGALGCLTYIHASYLPAMSRLCIAIMDRHITVHLASQRV